MAERRADGHDPWSDARLEAAFDALVPGQAPSHLSAAVALRVDDAGRRRRAPWLALTGLAAVLVAAVAGGALVTGLGPFAGYAVHEGTDGRSVFDAGEFSFSFPSAWKVTTTGQASSGGSSIAVLGTLPVESRCGIGRADINCIYEQPVDRGTIRVYVGTAAYRGSSILDRPAPENATTREVTVGGEPALLDEHAPVPDDFYRADLSLSLSIARPMGLSNIVSIELRAREPAVADARAAMQALIASFRFDPPPATLPPDSATGVALARAAITDADAAFRKGWLQPAATQNHLGCQPAEPGVENRTTIRFSSGGDLGGEVPVTCSWTLGREGDLLWRVELLVAWSAGGTSGEASTTLWLDATGAVVYQVEGGDNPPIVGQVATEPPTEPPTTRPGDTPPPSDAVLGLPVMTVEEAIAFLATNPGDAEIAVEGWWSGSPAIPCPYTPDSESSPAYPRCPDGFSYLMADPEGVVTVDATGMSSRRPSGPYLAPLVRDGVQVPSAPVPANGTAEPVRVVVLGHAHDHRAGLCPADARPDCEAAFLLDLAFQPGTTPPVARDDALDDGAVINGSEDRAVLLARGASGADAAVIAVLRLSPDALARTEPTLVASGSGMEPSGVTWLVKLLVPDGDRFRVRTLAIRDGDLSGVPEDPGVGIPVYEPTSDGVKVHAVRFHA